MGYRSILYRREGGITTITFNRPRELNALNREMLEEILGAVRSAAADPETKVLVLTGTGRAFCFGADISAFSQDDSRREEFSAASLLKTAQEIIRLLAEVEKPTIAALNGFATGLGLDLALACDLRIAADRAKLGEAFVSMGLVPDGGGTFFLPRLVGLAKAAEMIFTGEAIPAPEAERIGLVNRVVPLKEMETAVAEFAARLARGPSLAMGLAKRALRKNLGDLASALRLEAELQKTCLLSADHREAVQAFKERRPAVFGERSSQISHGID